MRKKPMLGSDSYPPATRGKIIVWSLLGTFPFGGVTWHRLHWLVGLRRLGFDVWYVEDSDRPIYHPQTFWPTSDYTANVAYISKQMIRVGLENRWIFRPPGVTNQYLGATDAAGLKRLYREADAVINLSGAQELRPDHAVIRNLVYIDTDPVAKQVAVANKNQRAIQFLDKHHHMFTYGENLGAPDCLIPIKRYNWHTTRPPVCLDWWANSSLPASDSALTTVANWKHTGKDVVWQGEIFYWSKHKEFLRFIDIATRSCLPLELAIGEISDDEQTRMRDHGWRIIPAVSLAEPETYRNYIWNSLGEFTVAKDQYVRPRSGWFSERSACYLAAGRPVITQDTGFGNRLPTGEGLFAFSNEDEALAAIDTIARNFKRQSSAALEIAREYFDAAKVLGDVMDQIGI
jgi:hypothetical protein